MFKPPLQIAKPYDPDRHNPDEYLIAAKQNGTRAYWDGYKLLTEDGETILAPTFFTQLPSSITLDGIICGKGYSEEETGKVVRARGGGKKAVEAWKDLTYHIFDSPGCPGSIRQRHNWLEGHFSQHPSRHHSVASWQDAAASFELLYETWLSEGEAGAILRRKETIYTPGQNDDLLERTPEQREMK